MSSNIFIVSSHYNEDLSWLTNQSDHNFVVYSKNENAKNILGLDEEKLKIIKNRGMEATSFLKFMIDRYDDLPEKIAFCHGHETSWHQNLSILEAISKYKGEDFLTLNNPYYRNSLFDGCPLFKNSEASQTSWDHIKKVTSDLGIMMPDRLDLTMGAQFIVDRKCIRSNDVSLYQRCFDWLNEQTMTEDFRAAIIFEQLWYLLMTGHGIEPKLINRTILSERGYKED